MDELKLDRTLGHTGGRRLAELLKQKKEDEKKTALFIRSSASHAEDALACITETLEADY